VTWEMVTHRRLSRPASWQFKGDAGQRAPAEYESAMPASRFPMKNIKRRSRPLVLRQDHED
jgi:hypothetical protein